MWEIFSLGQFWGPELSSTHPVTYKLPPVGFLAVKCVHFNLVAFYLSITIQQNLDLKLGLDTCSVLKRINWYHIWPFITPPLSRSGAFSRGKQKERWETERKTVKKALTCKCTVTYGSHHGPGLPSVSAVVACWHPPATAQDGNNPRQRNCDKEYESFHDKSWGGEEWRLLCGEKAYLCLQKTGAQQLSWGSAGLTGSTSSHICPPHTPHMWWEHPQPFASHPAVINVNISDTFHSCLNLNSLKSALPVLRSFISLWFVFVTAVTFFWHMYQTIIKLNEGHNWKRKLGSTLNLHVCIVKVA